MTAPPAPAGVAAKLDRARQMLQPLGERHPAARRALDLLDRDLLPRSAGGDSYLVCGIVGPNNAGKSALFNALVGREISPSVPAGGATRRLVGAASPDLLARLRAAPALARFRLRPHAGANRVEEALESPDDPAEVIVEAVESMPANLLLIDTPDFDSILADNRLASESLLAVADLVIAVVTRHSYQNREVVRFLEGWLAHGRPWLLVYNEGISEEVARSHTAKLVADVGHAPLALFWAPHSLAVQEGKERLLAHRLREHAAGEENLDLEELLRDANRVAEMKARAFAAAMARLRDELEVAADELAAEASEASQILAVAQARATATGTQVASSAMPAGPFIEAFRIVLDRRSNFLSRGWRKALRGVRLRIEGVARALGAGKPRELEPHGGKSLTEIEQTSLRRSWSSFWEEVVRDLGPESRESVRRQCRADVAAVLDADLAEARRVEARTAAVSALAERAADLDAFRSSCETLIEQAMEDRGFDLDIQTAADLATLAPIALAAAVIVQTGGFGIDIAIAGGGAVGTFLMDKYSHFLGSRILAEARRRWAAQRGEQLAAVMVDAALVRSAPLLRQVAERESRRVEEIRALRGSLA